MAAPEPQPAADPQPLAATDTSRAAGPKGRQPGRIGKSPVPAHLPEAAYRQLRRLGIDQGKTVQRMAEEAFNDYFAKHGLPEIAGATGS